jgi:hypothetical protein
MSEPADREKRLSILSGSEIEEMEKNVLFLETSRGTRLAFHEYGDPGGHPIFFYHGTGSHVHGMLLHKPGLEHGFRIIAPDRPGVARSDFRPGWTVLDYAGTWRLADHLGIGSFGAIGISGGGPTLMPAPLPFGPPPLVVDLPGHAVYADPEMVETSHHGPPLCLAGHPAAWPVRIPSQSGMTQKVVKSPDVRRMFDSSCARDRRFQDTRVPIC